MTQKLSETINPLLKLDFEVKDLMTFINGHGPIVWSWGVSNVTNIKNQGLLFKVNGHHHKGFDAQPDPARDEVQQRQWRGNDHPLSHGQRRNREWRRRYER